MESFWNQTNIWVISDCLCSCNMQMITKTVYSSQTKTICNLKIRKIYNKKVTVTYGTYCTIPSSSSIFVQSFVELHEILITDSIKFPAFFGGCISMKYFTIYKWLCKWDQRKLSLLFGNTNQTIIYSNLAQPYFFQSFVCSVKIIPLN